MLSSGKKIKCKLKLTFREHVRYGAKKEEGTSSSEKKKSSSSGSKTKSSSKKKNKCKF